MTIKIVNGEAVEMTRKELAAFVKDQAAIGETARVAAIKAEAGRRINEIGPMHKQTNLLSACVEVLLRQQNGETLTDADQATLADGTAMRVRISAIRAASNAAESAGTELGDVSWPE